MEIYSLYAVAERFSVSTEAIRKWCIEFEKYLSPRANPGGKQQRNLTEDDLAVIALVVERRADGVGYSEIHAELENGQRGNVPDLSLTPEANAVRTLERVQQAITENEKLHLQLMDYEDRIAHLEKVREEVIRVQATMEMERLRAQRAEDTIQQLLEERRELDREIARLRVKLEQETDSKDG